MITFDKEGHINSMTGKEGAIANHATATELVARINKMTKYNIDMLMLTNNTKNLIIQALTNYVRTLELEIHLQEKIEKI